MFDFSFTSISRYFDDTTLKRTKIITDTIDKLRNFSNIMQIPRVIKIMEKNKIVRETMLFFDDIGKFNITKINQSGLLGKLLYKNTNISAFLIKQADKIEEIFTGIARFNQFLPSDSEMYIMDLSKAIFKNIKKATSFVQKLGTVVTLVGLGYKLYQNYKNTHSFPKMLIGTLIDYVGDFTIFDGIILGSYFGGVGVMVGVGIGTAVMVTNFINPKFFTNLKQNVFLWYDKTFSATKHFEQEIEHDVFAIDKTVIEERIAFYQELEQKLDNAIQVLTDFQHKFADLTAGLSATIITQTQIARYIKKTTILQKEYITPTLHDLQAVFDETSSLFQLDFLLNNQVRTNLTIIKSNYIQLVKKLEQSSLLYNKMMNHLEIRTNMEIDMKVIAYYDKLQERKQIAQKLWDKVMFIEQEHYYE